MGEKVREADWRLLELEPGASLAEVHRAYHRRKALYSEETLATYNLMGDEERAAWVERIEDAYRRIVRALSAGGGVDAGDRRPDGTGVAAGTARPAGSDRPPTPVPATPRAPARRPIVRLPEAPSPEERPGAYLRAYREARSLSIETLSEETRIRKAHIEALEAEAWDSLPPPVYVRGFVLQLARALGIPDTEVLVEAVLARLRAG